MEEYGGHGCAKVHFKPSATALERDEDGYFVGCAATQGRGIYLSGWLAGNRCFFLLLVIMSGKFI